MTMVSCTHCGSPIEQFAPACFACGLLRMAEQNGDSIECEYHNGVPAVAVCVVCGKPVCGECSVLEEGRWFCVDPEHRRVAAQWRVIFTSSSEFEADMIERNLRQSGVECRVFSNAECSATFWIPSLHRTTVMVSRERLEEALHLLQRHRLLDDRESNAHTG